MRYLSVCSGIEAATVAWAPLGWEPVAFAEIDPFASAVLAHHYPDIPNVGDFTKIRGDEFGAVDLLVGGTPCQDFSIAGFRAGMVGDRGALTVEFLRLLDRLRPRWVVWENVPGVLSSNDGRDFGAFLGLLGEFGYGFAYRVLDAQYFGVAQRRRRVFVVGCLGDERCAAAVLFEPESLSGNPKPIREARQDITGTLSARPYTGRAGDGGGGLGTDFDLDGGLVAAPLTTRPYADRASEESNLVAATLLARWGPHGRGGTTEYETLVVVPATASTITRSAGHHGHSSPRGDGTDTLVAFSMRGRDGENVPEVHGDGSTVGALRAASGGSTRDIIAFSCKDDGQGAALDLAPTMRSMNHVNGNQNGGGQPCDRDARFCGTLDGAAPHAARSGAPARLP